MNFLDDLNKLNQGTEDNEFSDLNNKIYDEHNYILSPYKNPEFFNGLYNMCKDYYSDLPSNINGFTQEDLNQITYLNINSHSYRSYFENVISLDELKYFHNLWKINDYSFCNCIKLKSVIFPDKLKEIGKTSFNGCIFLRKIFFGKNIKKIGYDAFWNTSLEEVIIPENIEEIENSAFSYCYSLKRIVIPERFKNKIERIFYRYNTKTKKFEDLGVIDITYI